MGFMFERTSGARVFIPQGSELDAWKSGRYGLPGGSQVTMVRSDGKQTSGGPERRALNMVTWRVEPLPPVRVAAFHLACPTWS